LELDAPARSDDIQCAPARPVRRWGEPLWAADEPVARLQSAGPDALPLKIKLLAFINSGR
jgi:hypothetical protein